MRSYSALLGCSLRNNLLNAEAAKFLSEGLKKNTGLTTLEYAAYQTRSARGTYLRTFHTVKAH